MKLSVSIPDDLWVTVFRAGEPNSTTVQEGLRLLAAQRAEADGNGPMPGAQSTGYALTEGEHSPIPELLERLTKEARHLHDQGYQIGIDLASGLGWGDIEPLPTELERLRRLLFDFLEDPDFFHDPDSDVYGLGIGEAIAQGIFDYGIKAVQTDDGGWRDSPTFFLGMAQALNEVREAVRHGLYRPSSRAAEGESTP